MVRVSPSPVVSTVRTRLDCSWPKVADAVVPLLKEDILPPQDGPLLLLPTGALAGSGGGDGEPSELEKEEVPVSRSRTPVLPEELVVEETGKGCGGLFDLYEDC